MSWNSLVLSFLQYKSSGIKQLTHLCLLFIFTHLCLLFIFLTNFSESSFWPRGCNRSKLHFNYDYHRHTIDQKSILTMTARNLLFVQNDQTRHELWCALDFIWVWALTNPTSFSSILAICAGHIPLSLHTHSFLKFKISSTILLWYPGSISIFSISWLIIHLWWAEGVCKLSKERTGKLSLILLSCHKSTCITLAQNYKVGSCLDAC